MGVGGDVRVLREAEIAGSEGFWEGRGARMHSWVAARAY